MRAPHPSSGRNVTLNQFVDRPLAVAHALSEGALGGSRLESYLIVTGLLSGLSALCWPERGVDQKRFIELAVRHSAPALHASRISVPLLIQDLRQRKRLDLCERLAALRPMMFGGGYDARVLTGEEVDLDESSIRLAAPSLSLSRLRRYSYAALLYREVRCGMSHEYQLGRDATQVPMTERTAAVSYSNRSVRLSHDAGVDVVDRRESATRREIYFDLSWLLGMVSSIAASLDAGPLPLPKPAAWWISGAD